MTNYSDSFDITRSIPGKYTHVLTYLGKDSNGFAYAVEMNLSDDQEYILDLDGLKVNGKLYVYCLGRDYELNACPEDRYKYGLETYDFRVAKRMKY